MANNTEKVFTITVDYKTGLENLEKVEKSLRALKDEARNLAKSQKELDAQRKSGGVTLDEYNRKTEENKKRLGELKIATIQARDAKRLANQELRNSAKAMGAAEGSLAQLRAQLDRAKLGWVNMSEEMRKSAAGKEAERNITRLNAEVAKLERQMGSFGRNVGNYGSAFKGFLKSAGGWLLAVTGLSKGLGAIKDFTTESIKLAAAAEGVSTAFNKLNNPDLLKNLRRDTKGTVNDLLLMKSAVRAENFKIPLDQLGSLLKFAQQRAQETGESVDYLTESIINGIGRKSPLILDNLGISAVKLRDEVGKSGDFMAATIKIVNEELEKQGDLELTSADKAQQASVKWENAKLALGKRMSWLGNLWSEISGSIADGLVKIAGDTRTATEKFDDQVSTVVDLERKTKPLVQRYEELKSKTELNAEEHEELKRVIGQLHSIFPGYVSRWGDYGEVLDMNTEAIYNNIEAEQARLKWVHRDTIAALNKQIADAEKRKADAEKNYAKGVFREEVEYTGEGGRRETKIFQQTAEDVANLGKVIQDEGENLKGMNAELARITGSAWDEHVEKRKKFQEQEEKFNAMDEAALNEWIANKESAISNYLILADDVTNEYLALAKRIQSQKFGAGEDGGDGGGNKDADKRAQERLKKETALAYEIEQNKVSAMEDGVAKRLAQLDLNNKKELEKHAEEYSGFENYEELKTEVANRQAQDRQAIFSKATKEELESYRLLAADYETAMEATLAIDKKIAEERAKEEAKTAKKIEDIRKKAAEDIAKAETKGQVQADFINATIDNENERKNRLIQNEIEIREEKVKTYLAELEALKALGAIDSEEYENTLANLRNLQAEATNLGKVGNAEGKDERSFFRKMLGIPAGEKGDKEAEELKKELKEKAFDLASQVSGIVADAERNSIDRRLEREKKLIDDKANSEKKGAKARKDAGIITEEQYQKELEKIDKKADEERLKAEKKAFEDKKKVDTKYAIIDTLLAVGKVFATIPWPASIKPALMVAAEGAARVAAIQTQKFAEGGIVNMGTTPGGASLSMVKGPSHAQGGRRIYLEGSNVPIGEMEGDEIMAIINKRSSREIQRLSQINQMGGGKKFAAGGIAYGKIPAPADIPNASDYFNRIEQVRQKEMEMVNTRTAEQINAINSRIDNIRVHVVEYDITDTQNSIKTIVKQASF